MTFDSLYKYLIARETTLLLILNERLTGHLRRLLQAHKVEHRGSYVGKNTVVHLSYSIRHNNDRYRVKPMGYGK